MGQDFQNRLLALLEDLPDGQRICLKLFYVEELSYAEAARVAGYSLAEVKSHIQNGRRMLTMLWRQRYGEDWRTP